MAKRSGSADLPLHGGRVPAWLAVRMAALGRVICEAIALEYGSEELLRRFSHPFWFQSFGAVMGMDWHSSGITTSVIGALKRGLTPVQDELGLYVCGGRGRHSRKTPGELTLLGDRLGVDADALVRASRLTAKVDSAAVQDGFELYLHAFITTRSGAFCVVQQGMSAERRQARRYHWLSEGLTSFVEAPHSAIEGPNRGVIFNLTDARATRARAAQLELTRAGPDLVLRSLREIERHGGAQQVLFASSRERQESMSAWPCAADPEPSELASALAQRPERREAQASASPALARALRGSTVDFQTQPSALHLRDDGPQARAALPHLQLPGHHEVRASDVVLRRLHAALAAAAERGPSDFAELLLTPGIGARTVATLALVAEVLHGAPCRFSDPARFSLALGGKDGHPFPVPLRVYDRTLRILKQAVESARLGSDDKMHALRRLDAQARALEATVTGPSFEDFVATERALSPTYDGRTVAGPATRAGTVAVRQESAASSVSASGTNDEGRSAALRSGSEVRGRPRSRAEIAATPSAASARSTDAARQLRLPGLARRR